MPARLGWGTQVGDFQSVPESFGGAKDASHLHRCVTGKQKKSNNIALFRTVSNQSMRVNQKFCQSEGEEEQEGEPV